MTVLTHQEAAAFLRVNDATLRKLRRRGEIHGTLIGSQYRYIREHLEAYLKGTLRPTGPHRSKDTARFPLILTPQEEVVSIDQPKRPVHHRAFYSLHRRGTR